jgi:hypothetical protein
LKSVFFHPHLHPLPSREKEDEDDNAGKEKGAFTSPLRVNLSARLFLAEQYQDAVNDEDDAGNGHNDLRYAADENQNTDNDTNQSDDEFVGKYLH